MTLTEILDIVLIMVQGAQNYSQETVNPENPEGSKVSVIIPHEVYLAAYKYRPVDYENLRAAKEVLDSPERIFWGIREYNEGGWCYTGMASVLYVTESEIIDFPKGYVFAVYINQSLNVFDWGLEISDQGDIMSPKGWEERYKGRIWKNTS